jgi:hypothetical protein
VATQEARRCALCGRELTADDIADWAFSGLPARFLVCSQDQEKALEKMRQEREQGR